MRLTVSLPPLAPPPLENEWGGQIKDREKGIQEARGWMSAAAGRGIQIGAGRGI